MAGDRAGALAHIDDDAELARIRDGEHASVIAAELGVDNSAIYHRYAKRPEYLQARELGAEVRLETAEREITEAPDAFSLARARERFRAVAWRCEREFPGRWGAKQQVDVQGSISVTIARGSVLEAPHHEVTDAEIISGE
jgi:hypothetical protein